MKFLLSCLALLFSCQLFAQQPAPLPFDACSPQMPYGVPQTAKERTIKICRKAYALEYDPNAKLPIWVSYVLTPEHALGCGSRTKTFAPDQSLPKEYAASLKDFSKSGFDIGHFANDSDMRWDEQAELESNILSNMSPQKPRFNRGIWKKLEDSTRGWTISRAASLLIYTGPVYNKAQDPVIGNMITVPHGYFKVIIDLSSSEVQAFIFQHEGSNAELSEFVTSLAEVQRQTGLVLPMPAKPVFSESAWPRTVKTAIAAKQKVCALK